MAKIPVLKLLITISIYCCVFANGICSNIYGPTWIDLKNLMNSTLENMALSISLRSLFFCGGAILATFVYSLIDRQALYPLCILTKGLCVALIPLYADFTAFLAFSAIIGIVSGTADSSVNVWMLDIWKDRSAPFVQALQFFWSLGFIVSPLISNPFLSPDSKAKVQSVDENVTAMASVVSTTMVSASEKLVASANRDDFSTESPLTNSSDASPIGVASFENHQLVILESKLYIPYAIAGAICLIGSVSLLVIYMYGKIEQWSNKVASKEEYRAANQVDLRQQTEQPNFDDHPTLNYTKTVFYQTQILLYVGLMTSVFCGSEMTTLQYAATFCVQLDLGLTKHFGSMVVTGIAFSFAFGRFCGIFCAMKFKPICILYADWAIILLGNAILMLSNSGVHFLWIGAILIGFGYASFFAAIFSYLRERIVVTNFISSIIILFSLSANALGYPVFIGRYMEQMPLMMVYGNILCALIIALCFAALAILDWRFGIRVNILKKLEEEQKMNEMLEPTKTDS